MAGVELEPRHIKSRKDIGKSDGHTLTLITTFGGLQIIALYKNDKVEIVGAGSHCAIAKFEAEKKLKHNVQWNDEE